MLIHSAAGGVGLAAIHLARSVGAAVIATAGTKAKRDYLKALGVTHVFDSRSLTFYDEVMAATDGRGVDLVLNSLSGPALFHSLRCLAPFGRFLEIGKTDIYNNAKLPMERLGENVSYLVIDVDRLAAQKPLLHKCLLDKIIALHESGRVPAPKTTTLPLSRLTDAMKLMTRPQRVVADVERARFRKAYPHLEKDSRFAALLASRQDKRQRSGEAMAGTLSALDAAERPAALGAHLAKGLGRILGANGETLPLDTELETLGLDSLMLTQFQNWIFRNVGVNYPVMKLLKGPSLERVADDLLGLMTSSTDGGESVAAAADTSEADAVTAEAAWEIVNPWLVRRRGAEAAPTRLICFHSMGVGASLFTRFLLDPPSG